MEQKGHHQHWGGQLGAGKGRAPAESGSDAEEESDGQSANQRETHLEEQQVVEGWEGREGGQETVEREELLGRVSD